MRASVLVSLLFSLAFAWSSAVAQQADPVGGVRTRIVGIEIPTVANAPFTAKVLVTWNRPLVGGGTVSRKYYTQVARDSQGRVRREIRGFIPADSSEEPPLRTFTILDPVSGTRTTCIKATMNCATSSFQPHLDLSGDADESPGTNSNVTRQNLGQQNMFNLSVVGTRETVVGSGATRLAVTHTDVWYSPDLQMDLSVIRNSPQLGEVTLEVTELVRGEPDSSWLAIPSGYRVIGGPSQ
jgi:hypothetical protein